MSIEDLIEAQDDNSSLAQEQTLGSELRRGFARYFAPVAAAATLATAACAYLTDFSLLQSAGIVGAGIGTGTLLHYLREQIFSLEGESLTSRAVKAGLVGGGFLTQTALVSSIASSISDYASVALAQLGGFALSETLSHIVDRRNDDPGLSYRAVRGRGGLATASLLTAILPYVPAPTAQIDLTLDPDIFTFDRLTDTFSSFIEEEKPQPTIATGVYFKGAEMETESLLATAPGAEIDKRYLALTMAPALLAERESGVPAAVLLGIGLLHNNSLRGGNDTGVVDAQFIYMQELGAAIVRDHADVVEQYAADPIGLLDALGIVVRQSQDVSAQEIIEHYDLLTLVSSVRSSLQEKFPMEYEIDDAVVPIAQTYEHSGALRTTVYAQRFNHADHLLPGDLFVVGVQTDRPIHGVEARLTYTSGGVEEEYIFADHDFTLDKEGYVVMSTPVFSGITFGSEVTLHLNVTVPGDVISREYELPFKKRRFSWDSRLFGANEEGKCLPVDTGVETTDDAGTDERVDQELQDSGAFYTPIGGAIAILFAAKYPEPTMRDLFTNGYSHPLPEQYSCPEVSLGRYRKKCTESGQVKPYQHLGNDCSAPRGTPVYAVLPGVVDSSEWNSGYGKQVVVSHPAHIVTHSNHLSTYGVWKGDVVSVGESIGNVGNTGYSFGDHLHLEAEQCALNLQGDKECWLIDANSLAVMGNFDQVNFQR